MLNFKAFFIFLIMMIIIMIVQESLDSGEKDWNMVIAPAVKSSKKNQGQTVHKQRQRQKEGESGREEQKEQNL